MKREVFSRLESIGFCRGRGLVLDKEYFFRLLCFSFRGVGFCISLFSWVVFGDRFRLEGFFLCGRLF